MKTTNEITSAKRKTITIHRTFDLPLTVMWRAWTNEDTLKKWWGPNNFTCPRFIINFNVDGEYLAAMQNEKEGKISWSTGVYKEIVQHRKIVMTDNFSDGQGNVISAQEAGMPGDWKQPLLITVEFMDHKDDKGKTDFSLTQEDLPEEVYEDCIKGWQESFDKLEKNLK